MSALIDVSHCCDHHATEAIDELFAKAASDGGGDIWEPHHSPIVQMIIELFTQRGLLRSGSMNDELDAWLAGERHNPDAKSVVPPGYMDRWSSSELKLVRMYLEALPPADFTVDDWMLVIDYLAQTYFPHDELVAEADWLASRASVMGKVQANMEKVTPAQAGALLAAVPAPAVAGVQIGLSQVEQAMIKFGSVRCTEAVVSVVGAHKQALKQTILEYQQAALLGTKPAESLQTRLFDRFGVLNADWRRIAVTEAGEMANQGTIAALKPGARVRRLEQYKAACGFCRKIDGMEFEVVAPDAPNKDGWTQVWVGKTNVGRSAAPRKKTADGLVERTDAERWWPAGGTMHPHCRGTWLVVNRPPSAGDKKFTDWMNAALAATAG